MTRRHTSRSMIWRAESAAALLTDGDAAAALVAQSLGMVLEVRTAEKLEPFEIDFGELPLSDEDPGQSIDRDTSSPQESTFWQPFYYEQRAKQNPLRSQRAAGAGEIHRWLPPSSFPSLPNGWSIRD